MLKKLLIAALALTTPTLVQAATFQGFETGNDSFGGACLCFGVTSNDEDFFQDNGPLSFGRVVRVTGSTRVGTSSGQTSGDAEGKGNGIAVLLIENNRSTIQELNFRVDYDLQAEILSSRVGDATGLAALRVESLLPNGQTDATFADTQYTISTFAPTVGTSGPARVVFTTIIAPGETLILRISTLTSVFGTSGEYDISALATALLSYDQSSVSGAIPLPAGAPLLLGGLASLAVMRRRAAARNAVEPA